MLDGIDNVQWAALDHAFGKATDVPAAIRALRSGSREEREGAMSELMQTIWHQGTVYPATSRALPFLIELLRSQDMPDRGNVAYLVASIAAGGGYLEAHVQVPSIRDSAVKQAVEEGTTLEAKLSLEREHVDAVRLAAAEALPLLLPYLEDEEPEVRKCVAEALSCYPDRADEYLPLLQRALEREPDEGARADMRDSIRRLRGEPEPVSPASFAGIGAAPPGASLTRDRKWFWFLPLLAVATALFLQGYWAAAMVVAFLFLGVLSWILASASRPR